MTDRLTTRPRPSAGINFVVVAEPGTPAASMDQLLRKMYELYTDYALKNPFYGLDNPIRCAYTLTISDQSSVCFC